MKIYSIQLNSQPLGSESLSQKIAISLLRGESLATTQLFLDNITSYPVSIIESTTLYFIYARMFYTGYLHGLDVTLTVNETEGKEHTHTVGIAIVTSDPNNIPKMQSHHKFKYAQLDNSDLRWEFHESYPIGKKWVQISIKDAMNHVQWHNILYGEWRPKGQFSFLTGYKTEASGNHSFATGLLAKALGNTSVAIGKLSVAHGVSSFAGGLSSDAHGSQSFAFGISGKTRGNASISVGNFTRSNGDNSASFNYRAIANGENAMAFNRRTVANGKNSLAINEQSQANGDNSFASGYKTTSIGESSHSEGAYNTALGKCSHVEGGFLQGISEDEDGNIIINNTESNLYSNKSGGNASHVEGVSNRTGKFDTNDDYVNNTGFAAHAEGFGNKAEGDYSHAQGKQNIVTSKASHGGGVGNFINSLAGYVAGIANYISSPNSKTDSIFAGNNNTIMNTMIKGTNVILSGIHNMLSGGYGNLISNGEDNQIQNGFHNHIFASHNNTLQNTTFSSITSGQNITGQQSNTTYADMLKLNPRVLPVSAEIGTIAYQASDDKLYIYKPSGWVVII